MKPSDPMSEFEADVRQTARQLNGLDFSRESQQREATKERLIDMMYRQKPASNKDWWQQKSSRRTNLLTLASVAAAAFLLGVILVKVPTTPPYAVEMIVPTPFVPTPDPGQDVPGFMISEIGTQSRFYDTLQEAADAVDIPLFAPAPPSISESDTAPTSVLSPDDMLNFVSVTSESEGAAPSIVTSVYFKKTRWRISVLNGHADDDNMDYLYIMQEARTPSSLNRLTRLYHQLAGTNAASPDLVQHSGERFVAESPEGYHLVLAYDEDYLFLLASRAFSTEQLIAVADSMQPYPTEEEALFAPGDPGSCPGVKGGYGTSWVLPLQGKSYQLLNNFKEGHPGIDIGAPDGTPVYAAGDGTVIFAGESTYGYGKAVVLSHGATYTLYAHLSEVGVQCGQTVTAGSIIGMVGSTGNSSAPHLHFELIAADWTRLDPNSILNFLDLLSPNPTVLGPVCVDMCD